jgi:hypothetical protein
MLAACIDDVVGLLLEEIGAGDPYPASPYEGEEYIDNESEQVLCLIYKVFFHNHLID